MTSTSIPNIFRIFLLIIFGFINISQAREFKVYWNIPSFMCRNHKIYFDKNVTQQFGIIQNENDNFRGNQIAILYDPGKFPAILQNSITKQLFYRNNGVPQEGNLTEHFEYFTKHINELIPNKDFSGLAVIDFESWRPIYRQNFGSLQPYKKLSIYNERKLHPTWDEKHLNKEAIRRFELAGKKFMEDTIYLGRILRPNAKWGYYAFPYCFNGRPDTPETCSNLVKSENNRIQWLLDSSEIILPSVYLTETIKPENRLSMVRGRVAESLRLIQRSNVEKISKIYVYHRYLYTDTLRYLSEADTYGVLNTIKQSGADGVILWGSSNDLNTKKKCIEFESYLMNTMGPVLQSLQPVFSVKSPQI